MKTLSIKDVSREEELDGKAMDEVRGGGRLFVDINKETIKPFPDAKATENVAGCPGCGLAVMGDTSSRFLNVYTG
jgi:hypothetical protein